MKRKEYCVECGKTLRNYKQGDKKIHRKCWMLLRDKSERHYDHLFCKDKKRETMKKSIIIGVSPPYDDTTLDIAGNEINIEKGVEGEFPPTPSSSPASLLQSLSLPPQKQS
jgi:hypothetical protein